MSKKAHEEDTKAPPLNTVEVVVSFHGQKKGEEIPPARIYLFDHANRLIESKEVVKEPVTFRIATDQAYRVTVGPDVPGAKDQPVSLLMSQLAKGRAVSQDLVPQLSQGSLHFAIHPNIWRCWWQTCIIVHGSVRKLLNPGASNPQYAPICKGTVQIFQVDLDCTLDNLASFDVLSLKNSLIEAMQAPHLLVGDRDVTRPPIPTNHPPPEQIRAIGGTRFVRQIVGGKTSSSINLAAGDVGQADTLAAKSAAKPQTSMVEVAANLSTLQGVALKKYMIAQKAILWPFWCGLISDDAFCWQELGEVPIQSDGSFSAEVCFWCPEDFPDLYFEVIQNIDEIEREIYDPQIACNTYYNYDGTESVDIIITDPTAVACLPDPGRPIPGDDLYVWPTAIGNIDLRDITDLEGDPLTSTPLTGLVDGANPWGGTLSLQVIFDPRLKTLSNIRYYRWSYKFDGDQDFTQINAPVTHRYMNVTYNPLKIHLNPETLGPKPPVGGQTNLFEVPDPSPGDGWVDINDPYDRPFAYFDSTGNNLQPFTYTDALPRRSRLCTLMLEMFDVNGKLVPCSNLGGPGPFKFVLPDLPNLDQYTSILTSHNITPQGALIFRVRVDNNDTVAQLTGVTTPSGSADPCGILHYANLDDLVSTHYAATHPNDYLTWSLSISRGLWGGVASASGTTSSPPMSLPAPSTSGEFKNKASALLAGCTNAAFAVNLDVDATATDGYSRQSQYDRDATIAFALITP